MTRSGCPGPSWARLGVSSPGGTRAPARVQRGGNGGYWDVYSNLMTMEPYWKLGNVVRDSPSEIVRRYLDDETPGQRALREESGRSLSAVYGDPLSTRVYMSKDDLVDSYLGRYLRARRSG